MYMGIHLVTTCKNTYNKKSFNNNHYTDLHIKKIIKIIMILRKKPEDFNIIVVSNIEQQPH